MGFIHRTGSDKPNGRSPTYSDRLEAQRRAEWLSNMFPTTRIETMPRQIKRDQLMAASAISNNLKQVETMRDSIVQDAQRAPDNVVGSVLVLVHLDEVSIPRPYFLGMINSTIEDYRDQLKELGVDV